MTSQPLTDEWVSSYRQFGSPEHLHALGAVVMTYNLLEDLLAGLLRRYLTTSDYVSARLYASMTNNTRLDIARRAIADLEEDIEAAAHYLHFLKGFDVCAENRNYLMHSLGNQGIENDGVYNYLKFSQRDPTEIIDYPLRICDIREVADAAQDYYYYYSVARDWFSIWKSIPYDQRGIDGPASSPEKPPLPRKLSLICREALANDPSRR